MVIGANWSVGSGFLFLVDKMEVGVFEQKCFTVPANGKIADIERYVLER